MANATAYGDFGYLCSHIPGLAVCNLFVRRLVKENQTEILGLTSNDSSLTAPNALLTSDSVKTLPMGVRPICSIPKYGHDGSRGNVALFVVCPLMMMFGILLINRVHRRVAAVGRQELKIFLINYWITLPLTAIVQGSILQQAQLPIVVLTIFLQASVAATFWSLLATALVSTQIVEDGTIAALLPLALLWLLIFILYAMISADVAFNFIHLFSYSSKNLYKLYSPGLFTAVLILPLVALLLYFALNMYITFGILREWKPFAWTLLAGVLWCISQLVTFLLSEKLCSASGAKIDGTFIAVLLQSVAVWAIVQGWRISTESTWDDSDLQFFQSRQNLASYSTKDFKECDPQSEWNEEYDTSVVHLYQKQNYSHEKLRHSDY